jgi:hypothetical protein|tara:strand:- start:669 stop:770 length:102 start_codon:yes stop_codon:yes gene_type:complete
MMALMTFLAAVSAGICFIGFLEALQMINQALPQ